MQSPPLQNRHFQHLSEPPVSSQSLPPHTSQAKPEGFTLLELSIVLVIIGLLIGGIFVGQSLIHNAQLNAVITEFNRYQTATQAFKQQYQALPGDMNNATSFWGVAGGTGSDAACATVVSTTTATCNGNGDGQVSLENGLYLEHFRFWQHLANAKMIEGSYNGSTTGNGVANTAVIGVNVPVSRFAANIGWSTFFSAFLAGIEGQWFNTDYGTGHLLFAGTVASQPFTYNAGFTPKDSWSIDKKIDDGKPGLGNVIASEFPNCTNASNLNDLGTTYKLSYASAACSLIFLSNF